MNRAPDLRVDISSLPPLADIERAWIELQGRARPSFYLSWPWMRTWLITLPKHIHCKLINIRSREETVALGFMIPNSLRRRHLIRARTWSLNSTGVPDLDCMFIEHNGLLTREDDNVHATVALLNALEAHGWDELRFPGVSTSFVEILRSATPRVREDMRLLSRYVDLNDVRMAGADYVRTLGPNTRARIRRTAKDFALKHGEIQLQQATTINDAREFYAELKQLHQRYWIGRGERGSFSNSQFDNFHRTLIEDFHASGCIQLQRLCAGPRTVGLLYNFVLNGEVSMYQSGFDYSLMDAPNKQSPGLLMHAMAIQHNLDQSAARYDFLGGDNQYKQVLANRTEELWWVRVQRDALKFRVEDFAVRWWRRMHGRDE